MPLILLLPLLALAGGCADPCATPENEKVLAAAAAEKGAVRTESGLVFRQIKAGLGPKPEPRHRVRVLYEGRLPDGTVFDSSEKQGRSARVQAVRGDPRVGRRTADAERGRQGQAHHPPASRLQEERQAGQDPALLGADLRDRAARHLRLRDPLPEAAARLSLQPAHPRRGVVLPGFRGEDAERAVGEGQVDPGEAAAVGLAQGHGDLQGVAGVGA